MRFTSQRSYEKRYEMRIAVIGAGSWGTALGALLAQKGEDVTLWARDAAQVAQIVETGHNGKYLRDLELPRSISVTSNLKEAVSSADIILLAVASQSVREVLRAMSSWTRAQQLVINVSKGIEINSLKRISELVAEYMPLNPYCVLSGPSHAEEVAKGMPTTLVSGSRSRETAELVQDLFSTATLRVYTNPDVAGVELAGALKNIIAIGAGVCDGLGYGDNAKAALLTRGITEITRLGLVLGAKAETFAGLAGIGDLIVTCTSKHSRNRHFGNLIGQGMAVDDALKAVGMVVEGYFTTRSAWNLANRHSIDMPIINELYRILYEGMDVRESVNNLMLRSLTHESEQLARTGQWS